MSAEDKLRSFAEARVDGNTVIRDGLTYGDVRVILAELCVARQMRTAAQEAGTKAVMERRAAEEELRRLREDEPEFDERWRVAKKLEANGCEETSGLCSVFCSVCGAKLTLACPNCEVA